MKIAALIARRSDHSRAAFREHYEDVHVPLAMETVMEGTARYVRHHVAAEIHGAPFFDVVTAFWYRDAASAAKLMERLAGAQGQRIIADEHGFMDRDRNTFFAVEEYPVRGREDRSAGLAIAALVKAAPGEERDAFLARYEANEIPALLDATKSPAWCLQNRALAIAGPSPAFDAVTQAHALGDAGLAAWSRSLEASGAEVLVLAVTEHETETPWS